jgi:hypothetical protein
MTDETLKALKTIQDVINAAVNRGLFSDSGGVVVAHNASIHINQELVRLERCLTSALSELDEKETIS